MVSLMLNQAVQSISRNPRGLVKINGQYLPFESFEVENNSFYQADTFSINFAVSALPASYNAAWFALQNEIDVEIFAGFPANPDSYSESELKSLIYGRVDLLDWNVGATGLTISGRDMTAAFIDAKTQEKFQNLTASQIASALAKRHGLTANVAATKSKSGSYYQIDHSRMTRDMSEWDLLTYLADEEDFSVYVQSKTLNFVPKIDPKSDPYVLEWIAPNQDRGYSSFNGVSLSFSRNLTLAKDVIVTVQSFNPKTGKSIVKKATATHNKSTVLAGAAQPTGEAQTYVKTIPGLTPEQASQKAQSILADLSSHELRLSAELPADTLLSIQNMIKVTGTGSAFDTLYYPNTIVRSMSMQDGFRMSVQAKNHGVESETYA